MVFVASLALVGGYQVPAQATTASLKSFRVHATSSENRTLERIEIEVSIDSATSIRWVDVSCNRVRSSGGRPLLIRLFPEAFRTGSNAIVEFYGTTRLENPVANKATVGESTTWLLNFTWPRELALADEETCQLDATVLDNRGNSTDFTIGSLLTAGQNGLAVKNAVPTLFTGGRVAGNLVLGKESGPISLKSKVVVPEGSSLEVEEGATLQIQHSDWAFQVGGDLFIGGSGEVTKVTGNSERFIQVPATQRLANVKLENLDAANLGETEIDGGRSYSLSNSKVTGVSVQNFFYNEASVLVSGNSFAASSTVALKPANDSCKAFGIGITFPKNEIVVRNNSFYGGFGSDKQCQSWIFGAKRQVVEPTVSFQDNAFSTGKTHVGWFSSGDFVFTGSYFESKDARTSPEMLIWDSKDDLSLSGNVTFSNTRSLMPPGAPAFPSAGAKAGAVYQRTLQAFARNSTTLTTQQRAQVKAAVDANPRAEKFICTGIRYFDQPMSVNIMVRKRAKAACEYAKTLNPALSTWFQNKPTKARSYAGKVLLTIKN